LGAASQKRSEPCLVPKTREQRLVIDLGIVRGVDGDSDFNALHFGKQNDEVELIAFDILANGWR
jgi:bifunctional non-homologous end joining protein LigD